MSDVFISHVNRDELLARELARNLEEAGFATWFYERDSVGGLSYIEQVIEAITSSQAVLLIISPDSVQSGQVDAEVIEAFEGKKPFIPLLNGITYEEFYRLKPSWKLPLRAATALPIAANQCAAVMPRIVGGLKRMGIKPGGRAVSEAESKTAQTPETARHPIRIALSFPRIVLTGCASTIDVQVENRSAFILDEIELRLESRGLQTPAEKRLARLEPSQVARKIVEIAPAEPGDFLLQCFVRLKTRGQEQSYCGERRLRINERPAHETVINPAKIRGNITGESGRSPAQSGRTAELVARAELQTVNDLLAFELPENFHEIALEFGFEFPAPGRDVAPTAWSLPKAFAGSASAGAVLKLSPAEESAGQTLHFVSRPILRLGRSRQAADFVTWFLPRDPKNDEKTARLGKVQTIGEAVGSEIRLRDGDGTRASANGSRFDGKTLSPEKGTAVRHGGTLCLGGDYEIEVVPDMREQTEIRIKGIERCAGLPEAAANPLAGAVRFSARDSAPGGPEVIWLFTDAPFWIRGSGAVQFSAPDPRVPDGTVVYHRGCFWLGALLPQRIVLNGIALGAREIAPLASGNEVRLGSVLYRAEITT